MPVAQLLPNLFCGIEFGGPSRQRQQRHIGQLRQVRRGVPAGPIQYHNRMSSRGFRCADRLQLMPHGFGIGVGQHDPGRTVARRTECTKNIGSIRLLLPHHARARPFACPQSGLRSPLADPHFILKPDINLVRGDVRRHDRLHLERERFFKTPPALASRLAG
jgi:hypothetical protein